MVDIRDIPIRNVHLLYSHAKRYYIVGYTLLELRFNLDSGIFSQIILYKIGLHTSPEDI